ncbi:sigma-70 family RNA polymerase sigma factor [bacterium]|nr:sigma-70 family RNA polymerase sigma factor [bacterium]
MSSLTRILSAFQSSEPMAAEELLPLVYDELRSLAAARLAAERPGQTIQATALVHEAYLRLLGPEGESRDWSNPGHFFAAAANAMRQILVENARRKKARKYGGQMIRCELIDSLLGIDTSTDELLDLDEALMKLQEVNARAADVVHMRFFLEISVKEAADILGIDERTARNDWSYARVWLKRELDRS